MGRVKLSDVNDILTCSLCNGYLVDATTINACMHSFCWVCIVEHITILQNCFCPKCDSHINLSNLRRDYRLRSILLKIVPGLSLQNRRKANDEVDNLKDILPSTMSLCIEDKMFKSQYFFDCEDPISFSIQYLMNTHGVRCKNFAQESFKIRYLLAPAALKVSHIKKLLFNKYDLSYSKKPMNVDIIYENKILLDEFSLMDIAYIFQWKMESPMEIYFRFCGPDKNYKSSVKNIKLKKVDINFNHTGQYRAIKSIEPKYRKRKLHKVELYAKNNHLKIIIAKKSSRGKRYKFNSIDHNHSSTRNKTTERFIKNIEHEKNSRLEQLKVKDDDSSLKVAKLGIRKKPRVKQVDSSISCKNMQCIDKTKRLLNTENNNFTAKISSESDFIPTSKNYPEVKIDFCKFSLTTEQNSHSVNTNSSSTMNLIPKLIFDESTEGSLPKNYALYDGNVKTNRKCVFESLVKETNESNSTLSVIETCEKKICVERDGSSPSINIPRAKMGSPKQGIISDSFRTLNSLFFKEKMHREQPPLKCSEIFVNRTTYSEKLPCSAHGNVEKNSLNFSIIDKNHKNILDVSDIQQLNHPSKHNPILSNLKHYTEELKNDIATLGHVLDMEKISQNFWTTNEKQDSKPEFQYI